MGLALCHLIPRDAVLQVALLFLLVSCILQAVLVGYRGVETGVGSFVHRDDNGSGEIVHISSHSALYYGSKSAATLIRVCSFDVETANVTVRCARFVESFHAVCGLLVASLTTSILVFLCVLVGVVPFARTTTFLLCIACFLFFIPTALHTAAVSMLVAEAVRHAREEAIWNVLKCPQIIYRHGFLSTIAFVSEGLIAAGFVLVFFRVCISALFRPSIKQRNIERKDIDTVMKLHVVNDDWIRQKTVLQSHARSVRLEMVMLECNGEESKVDHDTKLNQNNFSKEPMSNATFVFRPSRCPSQVELDGRVDEEKEATES